MHKYNLMSKVVEIFCFALFIAWIAFAMIGIFYVARDISYKVSYEEQVKKTIQETIKIECLLGGDNVQTQ